MLELGAEDVDELELLLGLLLVGFEVGNFVERAERANVGFFVGLSVGARVGFLDGGASGALVGLPV